VSSWNETDRRSDWHGYIVIAILLPVAFIGAFELLNFLLEKLAEVFA